MYVYIYIKKNYTRIFIHAYLCIFTNICVYVCMYIYVIHIYICVYTLISIYRFKYTYIYIYRYDFIYISKYEYIVYIGKSMHVQSHKWRNLSLRQNQNKKWVNVSKVPCHLEVAKAILSVPHSVFHHHRSQCRSGFPSKKYCNRRSTQTFGQHYEGPSHCCPWDLVVLAGCTTRES